MPDNNAVALLNRTTLARADLSAISWELRAAMSAVADPWPDIGVPTSFPPAVQADARSLLMVLDHLCVPAGADIVIAWVKPLLDGITAGTRPTQPEAKARLALIVLALQDLAVGAFTVEAQAEIARSETFTPSAAVLHQVLEPASTRLRSKQRTLRRIATASPSGTP